MKLIMTKCIFVALIEIDISIKMKFFSHSNKLGESKNWPGNANLLFHYTDFKIRVELPFSIHQ